MKILIIEDDCLVANIYRNRFAVEGFEVEVAPDGAAGFQMLGEFRPDAVILDLLLPKMRGVDFLRRVRASEEFQELPVVVFSNTYLTNLVQDAWKAGATKCLSKAKCPPQELVGIVRKCLHRNAKGGPRICDSDTPLTTRRSVRTHLPAPNTSGTAEPEPETLCHDVPERLASLRSILNLLAKASDETDRLNLVHELCREIHALSGYAGTSSLIPLGQLLEPLEALLGELCDKPEEINTSTLRTVAMGIDSLDILVNQPGAAGSKDILSHSVLVVDDEAICQRAIEFALEKANLRPINVADPEEAYQLLTQRDFDLILLDANLGTTTGFELCARLRKLPHHDKTPVLFITRMNNFETRAQSIAAGGTDVVAKPFIFLELAVKALIYVLRNRFQRS